MLFDACRLLAAVKSGFLRIRAVGEMPDETFAGDCDYVVEDPDDEFHGWKIAVFNDCGGFDYFDSVTAPDGRSVTFDDMYATGTRSLFYAVEPDDQIQAWRLYAIDNREGYPETLVLPPDSRAHPK